MYAKQTQTDVEIPEKRDEEEEDETEIPTEPVRQELGTKKPHQDDTIQDKPVNHQYMHRISDVHD